MHDHHRLRGPIDRELVRLHVHDGRRPAGNSWGDVLAAVLPHGLTALHGASATVGVIGHLLGGGLGFHRRRVRARRVCGPVMLASGDAVEAIAIHRPELFWALRRACASDVN